MFISSVAATSVWASVTPPTGGCTPVSYELAHARLNTLDSPALTTVPAGQSIAARLGNLQTGVAYSITAVGICTDGTRTPRSEAVQFTPAAPASTHPIWLVSNYGSGELKGQGTTVSICQDAALTQCTTSTGSGTFLGPADILAVGDVTLVSNFAKYEGTTVSVCDRLLTKCTLSTGSDTFDSPGGMAIGPNTLWERRAAYTRLRALLTPGLELA